jgi:mannose-6-phosphate isomerase-like protein (cupin superfamily)
MPVRMLIKRLDDCIPFIANDGCSIREVLHPAHGDCVLPYSLAVADVAVGDATFRHRLDRIEVYCVLAGAGRLHVDDDSTLLGPGDTALVPAGAVQWIENVGPEPLRFAAIVSPPWAADGDERVA